MGRSKIFWKTNCHQYQCSDINCQFCTSWNIHWKKETVKVTSKLKKTYWSLWHHNTEQDKLSFIAPEKKLFWDARNFIFNIHSPKFDPIKDDDKESEFYKGQMCKERSECISDIDKKNSHNKRSKSSLIKRYLSLTIECRKMIIVTLTLKWN